MKIRYFIVLILATFFLAAPLTLFADVPLDQVKESVDNIINILKDPKLKLPSMTKERRNQIRKAVYDRFDFGEMAKRSLGIHWAKLSPAEKKNFTDLFSSLLEKSYINKIEKYTDEKIIYIADTVSDDIATVKTKIVTKRDVEIPIDYKLMKNGPKWLVYDVLIENVSLVNNYRTQFNQIIRNSSYEELVKKMKIKQDEQLLEAGEKKAQ